MSKTTKKVDTSIISIGDIHGHDTWKAGLNYWRPEEEKTLVDQFDKIVFIGDYVDDFDKTDNEIYNNFIEIIELKKKYPEKVILLLGNHDVQYFIESQKGNASGFRKSMYLRLKELFTQNEKLFQIAYQYKNYLWTHAGIHRGWYQLNIAEQTHVFRNGEKSEYLEIDKSGNIADTLNFCFETRHQPIFDCGLIRGGKQKVGGPLWADFNEVYNKPLLGYHQIIGHTRRKKINHYENYKGDTSTTFIDCLSITNEYKDNFYILNI